MGVYLLDGTADGRIKCTCKTRNGIDRRFTLGSRKTGNGMFSRLREHDRNANKNFWTEAIILTTSNNTFGPTEISWLEHKFCDMAMKTARYEVKNGNDPSPGNITEEKASELEDQIEFFKLILRAIGYKIFEPPQKISAPAAAKPDEEIFYLKRNIKKLGRTIHAQMRRTSDGYVVLAGSEISSSFGDRFSVQMKKRRQSANITDGILQADEIFSSSSSAAEFVIGNNANGKTEWKTRDGELLKNFS